MAAIQRTSTVLAARVTVSVAASIALGSLAGLSRAVEPLGLELVSDRQGVFVTAVRPRSLATTFVTPSGAGVVAGDRLLAVNFNPIFSAQEAAAIIKSIESPLILLHVARTVEMEPAWAWRRAAAGRVPPRDRRVFAIVAGDTDAPELGGMAQGGIDAFVDFLQRHLPDQQLAIHYLTGSNFSRAELARTFEAIDAFARPDDTLLLYLCCHGSTDEQAVKAISGASFSGSHVLWSAHAEPLLHDRLLAIIGRLDVRLKVLITDSSRVADGRLSRQPAARGMHVRQEKKVVKREVHLGNAVQDLFLLPEGLVDWYSCGPGEASTAVETAASQPAAGVFTLLAINALCASAAGEWERAHRTTAESIAELSQRTGVAAGQHPAMQAWVAPSLPFAGGGRFVTDDVDVTLISPDE